MAIFLGDTIINKKLLGVNKLNKIMLGVIEVFPNFAGAWTPAALFTAGVQGAWYDLSDITTLFQDSDGTIPVTALGQPIGKILDKSGNGNHLLQTNNAKRPLYDTQLEFRRMVLDGTMCMKSTTIDLSNTGAVTVFAGYSNGKTTGTGTLMETSASYLSNGGSFAALVPSLSTSRGSFGSNGGSGAGEKEAPGAPNGEYLPRVFTAFNKFSTTGDYGCDYIRSNGIPVDGLIGAGNSSVGIGPYGVHNLFVGARNEASNFMIGHISQMIIVGKECTADELTKTEAFIKAKLPNPTINIVGEFPSNPKVGVAITPVQFQATGGTAPYTWTTIGIPGQGVHLSSSGLLSGTPVTEGPYSVTIEATDANLYIGDRLYTGTVAPADVLITIDGDFPADMQVGVPITPFSFTAVGGTAPHTFSAYEGVMPAGLTLASNGLVSGTPSEAGPYTVTIGAQDSLGNNGYEVFSGDVAIDPNVWLPSNLFANGELGAWWDLQDMGHDGEMVLGAQVNPSPEFDSSTGWVVGSNNVITGGKFVANNGWASGQSSYSNALVFGKTYLVEFEVVDFVGVGSFQVRMGNAPTVDGVITVTGNGTYSAVLTAKDVGAGARLAIECTSAAGFSMAMTYLHVTEVIDGYHPVLFQDSNGAFPVTVADQPIGLVLDKRLGKPVEALTDPKFDVPSEWYETTGTGWSVVNGEAVYSNNPGVNSYLNTDIPSLEAGKTYLLKFNVKTAVGGYTAMLGGVQMAWLSGTGTKSQILTIGSTTQTLTFRSSDATSLVITEASVQEISPNYLAMSTAAARPALSARVNVGTYSEDISNAAYRKTGITVTQSPDGTFSNGKAGNLITNDNNTDHRFDCYPAMYGVASVCNFSFFIKNVDATTVRAAFGPGGSGVDVNLTTKELTYYGNYSSNGLVEDLGNGELRISFDTSVQVINSFNYMTVWLDYNTTSSASAHITGLQHSLGYGLEPYQWINAATDYDWKGRLMKARTDGVDDRLAASTALVYYPAFTSVQSVSYSSFDASLDSPVFGSTTPGNGFLTGRRPDMARFLYNVATSEFIDHPAVVEVNVPEVITQGANAGQRIYRVNDEALQSVAGAFNSGFNTTYPINIGYSQLTATYERAHIDWRGGIYINRALTQQEHDNTYNYLAGNPVSTAPSFDPASLFTGGVLGYCYDPLDLSTMSQDNAGTVPVTGVGQELGMLRDISGNNAHRTQVTQSKRPLASVNGYTFDGTDDGLQSIVDTSLGGEWTHILRTNPGADTQYLLMCSTSTNGFFGVGEQSAGTTASQGCAVSSIEVDGAIITNQRSSIYAALVNGDHTIIHKITSIDNTAFQSTFRVGDYTSYQYSGYYGREILINKALIGQELTDALAWVGGA